MMPIYGVKDNRLVKLTEAEALASTACKPGDFARYLERKHGLARRFNVQAWFVDDDKPQRVRIVEVRGARLEFIGPAEYALTDTGRLLPVLYLFPVARHLKPRLARLRDEMGAFTQWVAPLQDRCRQPWD